MKVAIVTIYDLNNFGNRLQNYALSYFLEKSFGIKAITLSKTSKKGYIKENLKKYLKNSAKLIKSLKNPNPSDDFKKKKRFEAFTYDNTNVGFFFQEDFSALAGKFDYFIVGSDQVWNPVWGIYNKNPDFQKGAAERFKKYLLVDIPKEKRISYAASIGVENFPDEITGKFADEIKKFKAVSVREQRGAEIIKEISGVDAEVLIDPTMLLTKEDWLKVAKRHTRRSSKPYAFKYFLGEQSDKRKAYIRKIAKKNGLGIYDLMNAKSKVYTSGPAEFIDLIANAEVVFTDSFHACVFSILMGRPFVIMNREQAGMGNMNSRIVTLLEKLELEDRLPGKVAEDKIFEFNYEKAYHNLEIEREKAKAFLEKSLNNL